MPLYQPGDVVELHPQYRHQKSMTITEIKPRSPVNCYVGVVTGGNGVPYGFGDRAICRKIGHVAYSVSVVCPRTRRQEAYNADYGKRVAQARARMDPANAEAWNFLATLEPGDEIMVCHGKRKAIKRATFDEVLPGGTYHFGATIVNGERYKFMILSLVVPEQKP